MGKSKSNKTFVEIQMDQRPTYRARWEQVFEDDKEKRKRPRGTRFIVEDFGLDEDESKDNEENPEEVRGEDNDS